LLQNGGGGALQVRLLFLYRSPRLAAEVPYTFTKDKKQNFFIIYIKFAREVHTYSLKY